jgi:hypothetical protein
MKSILMAKLSWVVVVPNEVGGIVQFRLQGRLAEDWAELACMEPQSVVQFGIFRCSPISGACAMHEHLAATYVCLIRGAVSPHDLLHGPRKRNRIRGRHSSVVSFIFPLYTALMSYVYLGTYQARRHNRRFQGIDCQRAQQSPSSLPPTMHVQAALEEKLSRRPRLGCLSPSPCPRRALG